MRRVEMAAAIVLLLDMVLPTGALAQAEEFLPDSYTNRPTVEMPTDACGAEIAPTRRNRRELTETRPGTVVADPDGQIDGADPDPNVRFELRRDSSCVRTGDC
jgi:hypothetical protein